MVGICRGEPTGKQTGERSEILAMNDIMTLVVDDDPLLTKLVQYRLEREGISSDVASSGEAALEMVRKNRYRVIICDVNMPGINGVDLVREIKQIAPIAQIIMLTADDKMATTIDAIGYGACEYISKTDDLTLLIDETESCLHRAERWWKSFEKRPSRTAVAPVAQPD